MVGPRAASPGAPPDAPIAQDGVGLAPKWLADITGELIRRALADDARRDFVEPLTWDEQRGRTWCTLKNGSNWSDLVKCDVGYGEFIFNPEKPRPKTLKPPRPKLLEHIAVGHRDVIVVSQPEGDARAPAWGRYAGDLRARPPSSS